jgi:beta-N-acetylhexosaminidase
MRQGVVRTAAALGVAAAIVSAIGVGAGRAETPRATQAKTRSTPAPRATAAGPWTERTLKRMTLRQKAAQLVWPWILGDYVPEGSAEWGRLMQLVLDDEVGGFIVSVGTPTEIASKVNALQRLSKLPLLMSADYETGVGFRARGAYFVPNEIDLGGATNFPLQMALGASRDSALAYQMGRATAREARALGVHVAFGPVLDVNNNPNNPVIAARSLGEDPASVARLGVALMRGMQDNGVVATGKHFPGHGDTEINSHLALPTVAVSRARLDSVELPPFRAAITAGLGAMMTFHGILPALDTTGVPATLSRAVLTGLLRDEMRFQGLIITDAMDMVGVVQQFGAREAVVRAVVAGADVVLMPKDTKSSIDAIVEAVKAGRITEARLDASVRRILALKEKFGLHRHRLVSIDSVRVVVGDSSHVELARRIAERGLTLVRDSLAQVPLAPARSAPRVLTIIVTPRGDLAAGPAFTSTLRASYPGLRSELMLPNVERDGGNVARLLAAADSADQVIVASYMIQTSESATATAPGSLPSLVRGLVARGKSPVVVAFGNPYLLREIPEARAYLVAWGGSTASQVAAARALAGQVPITGRLPVSIPPLVPLGAGVSRVVRTPSIP